MALELKNLEIIWDIVLIEFNKCFLKSQLPNADARIIKDEMLRTLRYKLEPFIYNYLSETYGTKLSEFWRTWTPPLRSKRAFVLVERRSHPNMWFILRNMAWAGPTMSIYIVCSDENYLFIKTLLGDKAEHVTFLPFFKGNPPVDQAIQEYCDLYTDYRFYELFASHGVEYILTVQMDVFFRKQLTDELFYTEYLGAAWAWIQNGGGCGGASVRLVSKMIEVCKRFRPDLGVKCPGAEDGWIDDKLKEMGHIYPEFNQRANLIMESVFVEDPYIIHQYWTFLGNGISLINNKDDFLQKFVYHFIKLHI
jgi:hypothetical protein